MNIKINRLCSKSGTCLKFKLMAYVDESADNAKVSRRDIILRCQNHDICSNIFKNLKQIDLKTYNSDIVIKDEEF